MENYIVYNKLGAGNNCVVYKGRKRGNLSFVALIRANKSMKPFITNHVYICTKLHHPNVVSFFEWYETNTHLWCVVELCTGGSLRSLIDHDNGCPEETVRRFGWDLVKGLNYIHKSGIVVSYLNPSKILLDGSCVLKFGNFCLSKKAGGTQEDWLNVCSLSEEKFENDPQTTIDSIMTNLQGPQAYSAPEVLQGSETSVSSDLWALGSLLYYMYTGKPPFRPDHSKELTEIVLHLEQSPLKKNESSHTPPSDDFTNLLKGLLKNNPDERMKWPELLTHPFWTQVRKDEVEVTDDSEDESTEGKKSQTTFGSAFSRDTSISKPSSPGETDKLSYQHSVITQSDSGMSQTKSQGVLNRQEGNLRRGEESESEDHYKQIQDKVSVLTPKSIVVENDMEATFMISRSCSIPDSLDLTTERQASVETDFTNHVKDLLYPDSDVTTCSLMAMLKLNPAKFDPNNLCVAAYSVKELLSLGDENWTVFISEICSSLEPNHVAHSPALKTHHAGVRSRLQLLCYLCNVIQSNVIANRLINSKLLPILNKRIKESSQWELQMKVISVLGLLALHCTELREDSIVIEVVSTLSELLLLNFRKNALKLYILAALGEFLYLIFSQEKKRGSPEGLWFVPAAAYTGLMRSLREGTDSEILLMAVKAIENITATVTNSSHTLLKLDICSHLWYLFTHSKWDAVKVAAVSSLSRLVRVVPTLFLSVIDTCGPAAILEILGGAGAMIQQHLLTVLAASLLASCNHMQRFSLKECVVKVLQCMESPSAMTKAKASLLMLLLLKQDNTHILLHFCAHRLMKRIDKELSTMQASKKNHKYSAYLSQCLESLVVHLNNTASLILEDTLSTLQCLTGKKNSDGDRCKKLQLTTLTLSALLELILSKVLRSKIVSYHFLTRIGLLLNYLASMSRKANLLGVRMSDALIITSLSIVEAFSRHQALISQHQGVVVSSILPPVTQLVFANSVGVMLVGLLVLSNLTEYLLVPESDGVEQSHGTNAKEEQGERSEIINLFSRKLFPRYESLLKAEHPVPASALKLLVLMTKHSTQICRLIKRSEMLPMVFQVIMANSDDVNSKVVQNAVALLANIWGSSMSDQGPNLQTGVIGVLINALPKAAVVHLNKKTGEHVALQALLDLLHSILQESVITCSVLQSQRPSCPTAETKAAENVFLQNRPLSQLSTHLIDMLVSEKQEVWEESLRCLSLLVRLYGGEGEACLSHSCLKSFLHVLRKHMQDETTHSTLEIIKCLVNMMKTTKSPDWMESPEGSELKNLLQDMCTSNRFHDDVVQLAAEIHLLIQGSKPRSADQ